MGVPGLLSINTYARAKTGFGSLYNLSRRELQTTDTDLQGQFVSGMLKS